MKKLLETRAALLAKVEKLTGCDDAEVRALSEEELKTVDELIAKIEEIDKQLKVLKEVKNLKNTTEVEQDKEPDAEMRSRLLSGAEVEIRDMTTANTKGITTFNGELVQDRPKELALKDYARIERFNGVSIIPVQKSKMGKLVKAAELAEIAKQDILVDRVDLHPEKYSLLTVISEELLNDASYDVEALIRKEGNEAIEETVEGMIADVLNEATDVIEVAPKAAGTISLQDINALYFGLDAKYRKNAIFVVNSEHLKALFNLVGTDGHPILTRDITQQFGFTIYGRPVILCDEIENMMFVDMEKAVVVGMGKDAQVVKRSDDAYFTSYGIAFRTTVALDVKACIAKAIAKLGTAA